MSKFVVVFRATFFLFFFVLPFLRNDILVFICSLAISFLEQTYTQFGFRMQKRAINYRQSEKRYRTSTDDDNDTMERWRWQRRRRNGAKTSSHKTKNPKMKLIEILALRRNRLCIRSRDQFPLKPKKRTELWSSTSSNAEKRQTTLNSFSDWK